MKRLMALLIAALVIAAGLWVWLVALTARPARFDQPRIVAIRRGESFAEVADELAVQGVVRSKIMTIAYGRWTGEGSRVRPGEYAFAGGESISEVMRHLVRGDSLAISVTIPEGVTAHEIGRRLAAAGLVCDGDFDRAAANGALVRALGLERTGAEGFLFPATYRFPASVGVNQILAAMLERFYSVLTPAMEARMFELGLNQNQLITLASMIEREAKMPGERPVIASVFYNRLAAGMPLQSDPTAEYNTSGETVRAVEAVRTVTAFNTYTNAGLPPGPIANPGLSAIDAALYPASTDYLYFVARSDGTHIFSRSFSEHLRAIAQLRREAAGAAPR
jgi:peptidoglycan lytic transglycosylase G